MRSSRVYSGVEQSEVGALRRCRRDSSRLFSSTAFMAPQAGLKLADLLVRRDREQEAARVLDTLESRWPTLSKCYTAAAIMNLGIETLSGKLK